MASAPKKTCAFYAKGECKNGTACRFVHDPATKVVSNCKFGFDCNRQDCKFNHPTGRKIDGDCKFGWHCTHEVCKYVHRVPRMRDTDCTKCGAIPDEKCGFKHAIGAPISPKHPAPLPPVSVVLAAEVPAVVAEVPAVVAEMKIGESGNLKSPDDIQEWMNMYDGNGSDFVQIPEVKECCFRSIVVSYATAAKEQRAIMEQVMLIEDEIRQKQKSGANASEIDQLNEQARSVIDNRSDVMGILSQINTWVAKNRLNEKFNKAYGLLSALATA